MTNEHELDNALCRNFDEQDRGIITPHRDHDQYIGPVLVVVKKGSPERAEAMAVIEKVA